MSTFISTVLPFILVLSILVFVHEYGHFWVGRRNGVRVSTFSIGFGPELFGWTDKHGTRWRVSPIPLGGYVKFFGDQDVSSTTVDKCLVSTLSDAEKATMLHNKTPLQRIAVAVAGPAANYLFAIIALTALIAVKGMPVQVTSISHVEPGSLADKIGIKIDDKIIQFGTHEIKKFTDIRAAISDSANKDVAIIIERNNAQVVLGAKLYTEENAVRIPIKTLGIAPSTVYEKASLISALGKSIHYCYSMSAEILKMIGNIFTGASKGEVGGFIAIAEGASQSWHGGPAALVLFMVMLSINLGFINLLPVPVLDGGHILFCTIEAIRGRPLSEKLQERIFMAGLALVLGLMLYTTGSDIMRKKSWFVDVYTSVTHMVGIK